MFTAGLQFHTAGRLEEAIARYEKALLREPGFADAHNNLAVALLTQGRVDEAALHFEQALALRPGSAEAHNNLANWLSTQGRMNRALEHYGRAIALRPDYAEAHFNRAEIRTFGAGDTELAALEELAQRAELPAGDRPYIHFALGKALEDCGEYRRAFEHLRRGNAAKRAQIPYDEASAARVFARTKAVFTREVIERFHGAGEPSAVPIFVLGMPRSGSTLVEQILAGHPQVHAAGERTDLEQVIGAFAGVNLDGAVLRRMGQTYVARLAALGNGKARVVDKLPGNFLHIGLIRMMLPNARIVHTLRDPVDTCVSCYSKLFTASQLFSYDLGELGRHYSRYADLMAHWRSVFPEGSVLDVVYEDVVNDPEGQARRLIEYCGLPWDERSVEFHRTKRAVQTASAAQVRKPVYRSSLQRWRRYEADLGPLLAELAGVAKAAGFAARS